VARNDGSPYMFTQVRTSAPQTNSTFRLSSSERKIASLALGYGMLFFAYLEWGIWWQTEVRIHSKYSLVAYEFRYVLIGINTLAMQAVLVAAVLFRSRARHVLLGFWLLNCSLCFIWLRSFKACIQSQTSHIPAGIAILLLILSAILLACDRVSRK